MLKSYFKIAHRNLLKNKVFSLINIFGLAIGMAACLIILRYVVFESSYDTFHPEPDRLYRVALRSSLFGDNRDVSVANHPAVGRTLYADFPEVTDFTRLFPLSIWLETVAIQIEQPNTRETYIEEHVYVADTAFLSLFSFPFLKGDANALQEPSTVVLTASIAQKYFGTTDALGRNIYLDGNMSFRVSGVLADIPDNIHLQFDILVSSATPVFSFLDNNSEAEYNWKWPEYYTYVRLASGADLTEVAAKLPILLSIGSKRLAFAKCWGLPFRV